MRINFGIYSIGRVIQPALLQFDMTVSDFLKNTWKNYQDEGFYTSAKFAGSQLFRDGPLARLDRLGYNRGPNIYEFDWDLVIVLDACRADLMKEVFQDYQFVDEFDTILTVASKSQQWMDRTFVSEYEDEIAKTTYITANMFSRRLDPQDFNYLDEIWRTQWDDDLGTVPPRPVTDRAITELRENDPDRLLVHYMQPHYPFIKNKLADGINLDFAFYREGSETNVWNRLQAGEVAKSEVWEAYRENLRLVMDNVGLLLNNADVDNAIITADHGNSFGTLGIYGHPPSSPLRCLRNVPFIRTSGSNNETYRPEITDRSGPRPSEEDVSEKLSALGYK